MAHRFAEFVTLVIFGLIGHSAAQAPIAPSPLPPLIKPVASLNIPVPAPSPKLATESLPVAPPGSYANTYAPGNCTTYVASRVKVPETWGNATTWATRAASEGLTVSPVPMIGAIAQKSGGLGHVAIVEAVNGDQVEVTEMNVQGFGVIDEAWYPIPTFQYIYV